MFPLMTKVRNKAWEGVSVGWNHLGWNSYRNNTGTRRFQTGDTKLDTKANRNQLGVYGQLAYIDLCCLRRILYLPLVGTDHVSPRKLA